MDCPYQPHEDAHIDDLRHLDEDERAILYRLAHRWRLEHDAAAPHRNALIIPLRSVGAS